VQELGKRPQMLSVIQREDGWGGGIMGRGVVSNSCTGDDVKGADVACIQSGVGNTNLMTQGSSG
jgi:hypothetical protein